MAGEDIKIISGKPICIRVKAPADATKGDYLHVAGQGSGGTAFDGVPGFWLHDVKKDEVGDLCISCDIVEIPNNSKKHVAGSIINGTPTGLDYEFAQGDYRRSPHATAIVYEETLRSADRILVVWGLF